jgi:hypothetical protein
MDTVDNTISKAPQQESALIDRLKDMASSEDLKEILGQLRFAALSINLAGRQRMLLQKVCKEFYMVLAEIEPIASRRLMRKSLSAFESSLKVLIRNAEKGVLPKDISARLLYALREVDLTWESFGRVLKKVAEGTETPTRKEISYINVSNDDLLLKLEKLVEVYENLAYELHA